MCVCVRRCLNSVTPHTRIATAERERERRRFRFLAFLCLFGARGKGSFAHRQILALYPLVFFSPPFLIPSFLSKCVCLSASQTVGYVCWEERSINRRRGACVCVYVCVCKWCARYAKSSFSLAPSLAPSPCWTCFTRLPLKVQ